MPPPRRTPVRRPSVARCRMSAWSHFEVELSGSVSVVRAVAGSNPLLRGLENPAGERALSFRDELDRLLDAAPGAVVIDLRSLPFVNSEGVGLMVHAAHRLAARGHRFGVCATPDTMKVFDLTRVTKLFPCGTDLAEVVARVSAG